MDSERDCNRINKGDEAMKEILTVWWTPQGYMADYSRTHEAEYMIRLFGSALIPSAFTDKADPNMVKSKIAELNREYDIVVR